MEEHPYSVSDTVDYPESPMQTVMPPTEEAVGGGAANTTVQIYNDTDTKFLAGFAVTLENKQKINGAIPARFVNDTDTSYGVCEEDIEAGGVGSCVVSGVVRVLLSRRDVTRLPYIKPTNNGYFSYDWHGLTKTLYDFGNDPCIALLDFHDHRQVILASVTGGNNQDGFTFQDKETVATPNEVFHVLNMQNSNKAVLPSGYSIILHRDKNGNLWGEAPLWR